MINLLGQGVSDAPNSRFSENEEGFLSSIRSHSSSSNTVSSDQNIPIFNFNGTRIGVASGYTDLARPRVEALGKAITAYRTNPDFNALFSDKKYWDPVFEKLEKTYYPPMEAQYKVVEQIEDNQRNPETKLSRRDYSFVYSDAAQKLWLGIVKPAFDGAIKDEIGKISDLSHSNFKRIDRIKKEERRKYRVEKGYPIQNDVIPLLGLDLDIHQKLSSERRGYARMVELSDILWSIQDNLNYQLPQDGMPYPTP